MHNTRVHCAASCAMCIVHLSTTIIENCWKFEPISITANRKGLKQMLNWIFDSICIVSMAGVRIYVSKNLEKKYKIKFIEFSERIERVYIHIVLMSVSSFLNNCNTFSLSNVTRLKWSSNLILLFPYKFETHSTVASHAFM